MKAVGVRLGCCRHKEGRGNEVRRCCRRLGGVSVWVRCQRDRGRSVERCSDRGEGRQRLPRLRGETGLSALRRLPAQAENRSLDARHRSTVPLTPMRSWPRMALAGILWCVVMAGLQWFQRGFGIDFASGMAIGFGLAIVILGYAVGWRWADLRPEEPEPHDQSPRRPHEASGILELDATSVRDLPPKGRPPPLRPPQ